MKALLDPIRKTRAQLLTPSLREVETSVRGFYPWCEGPSIVEPVGRAFLGGYRIGMEESTPTRVMRNLQAFDNAYLGFAAEGAGMAVAIRSRLEPWNRSAFDRLIATSGGRHTYMMHVGLGWALARLPKPLWPTLHTLDPLVGPLVADGYGFHEVFFNTHQTLSDGLLFEPRQWPGPPAHAQQQAMQGVGRGIWFVAGGDVDIAKDLLSRFPTHVHASLWAGLGLAATYAGGRSDLGLTGLRHVADTFLPWVRQGSAFAAEARTRAGTTTSHTHRAVQILCGRTVPEVVDLVARTRPKVRTVDDGDWGSYETWRESLALEIAP